MFSDYTDFAGYGNDRCNFCYNHCVQVYFQGCFMTAVCARNLIKSKLDELSLQYERVTSWSSSYVDLSCDPGIRSRICVKVHGWKPDQRWIVLLKLAADNGFCLY